MQSPDRGADFPASVISSSLGTTRLNPY